MKYIRIEDYFNEVSGLSSVDYKHLKSLREEINYKKTVADQYRFIDDRRKSNRNVLWDSKILGIPRTSKVDESYFNVLKANKDYDDLDSDHIDLSDFEELDADNNKSGNVFKDWSREKTECIRIKIRSLKKFKLLIIFILIILVIYFIGLTINVISGSTELFGSTPFEVCTKEGVNTIQGSDADFSKVIKVDGVDIKIPGNVYEYSDYDGWSVGDIIDTDDYALTDDDRGKGAFITEDFEGLNVDCETEYKVVMRWEYANIKFTAENDFSNDVDKNGLVTGDRILDTVKSNKTYTNTTLENLKCLIINPETQQGVICSIGGYSDDGAYNSNWGPGPAGRLGGMTKAGMDSIGIKSFDQVDVYFVNPEIAANIQDGPYNGTFSIAKSGGCKIQSSNIGFASIADSAISMAWETKNEAGNDGTDVYKNAIDSYKIGYYKACASLVSAAVLSSNADPDFPATPAVATIEEYITGDGSSKWEELGRITETDMIPGDIILIEGDGATSKTYSHVLVYCGIETIQKMYPTSNGNVVEAQLDSQSAYVENKTYFTNDTSTGYNVFRLKN